jgi:hypothetical protein
VQGSGNLGALVVSALISTGFKVSVAVRQSSAATYAASATVYKTDYSEDSLASIFQGQDAVVSCIPRTRVADQKTVVDACIRAGVKRFLPSEYSGDTTLPDIEKRISFTAGKKEFGEYLIGKESEGLTWTRVFTGPFFDWVCYNYSHCSQSRLRPSPGTLGLLETDPSLVDAYPVCARIET